MKRLLLCFVIFLYSNAYFSQNWCYPGATWHFTRGTVSSGGYKKFTYVYDTLILGKNCNKIVTYTQGFGVTGPFAYFGQPIFTYTNNNVIYIKDVLGLSNNFDTLFNFGATIGAKWRLAPTSWTTCSNANVTVQDTGHSLIQGQWLKWFKVSVFGPTYSSPATDTIYERLGCLNMYFYHPGDVCPKYIDSNDGGPLRCYSDNQIINYKHNYPNSCTYYVTSINEMEKLINLKVYPNPVANILNVIDEQNILKNSNFKIRNSLGQIVLTSNELKINVSELKTGFYFIEIDDPNFNHHIKFLKE